YGETSCTVCDSTCSSVAGVLTGYCGDSITNGPEGCDDGNTITESCLYGETSCTVCDSTCSSVAGVLTGYCGDSITNGPEGCDDGNTITGDGCDLCVVETATPVCGNTITESGETCDDGNTITESCLYGETSCTVCDSTCNSVAGAVTGYCGDGAINGGETCDDSNTVTESCVYGETSCTVCDATCNSVAGTVTGYCGDGAINGGETCDDSNTVTESCVYGETSCTVCDATCNSVAGAVTGFCGDGAINGGETCDDSNTVTESCVYGETSCTVCDATCSSVAGALTGYCGDSITNGPEGCDDGNTITGDGCDLCVVETATPVCGNSITESGETCDDGNTITESCLYGETSCTVCDATCNSVAGALTGYCGDGATNGSEECDDANASDNDACLNNCTAATCGDGFIQAGFEECDDADLDNTDICLDTCQLATCGDSFVQLGVEACDDGNALNTDACLNTCEAASCGDGFIESGVETCDDANTVTESCVYGETSCTVCDSTCNSVAGAVTGYCGDGAINGGETCDDSNTVTESCVYGETSCTVCDSTCNSVAGAVTGYCGDGAINGGETCDDSNTVTESCVYGETSCTVCDATCNSVAGAVTGYCGDGAINGGETCDDSNTVTESCVYGETSCTVCDATCNSVAGALTGYCGDGATNGPEECDDANASDNDACLNNCTAATCGDGFIQAGVEECDDADLDNTDICLDTCQLATCGDSFVQLGVEACDDGNALNTDACLNTCEAASCGDGFIESGVETCDDANTVTESCVYGETSCTVCDATCNSVAGAVTGYCGDGAINGGETCDDSNTVTESCAYGETSCTVCDATCNSVAGTTTYCGDSITDGANGETCDENAVQSGTCEANCQNPICGDGIVNAFISETCDDGNTTAGDKCSSTCTVEPEGSVATPITLVYGVDLPHSAQVSGSSPNSYYKITGLSASIEYIALNTDATGDSDLYVYSDAAFLTQLCSDFGTIISDKNCLFTAPATGIVYIKTDSDSLVDLFHTLNVVEHLCGDNMVYGTEVCDDGNTTSGDGCNATCSTITTTEADIYEVDDTPAGASAITPNSTQFHTIHTAGNVDYISLNITDTTKTYLFKTSDGAGSCDMDTVIYLYDTDGTTLLTFDDQSGMGNCSAFAYQFTSSGTYFIKVEDYLSGTGSYVLEAYDYVPENQAPIADTWDSDTSGVVGNPVLLDGNWSLDSDWSNCGSSGTLNYLWEIASAPGGSTATIAGNTLMTTSFTPDMAGTYEIQLTVTDDSGYCSGGNKSDTVSLFIDAIIWPPTTIGTIIVDGGYQTVTVNSIVYVEFSVAAGNTYTINWDDDYDGSGTYSGGGDIYASAYNPNGSAIFTNIDSGYPNGFDGEGQTFTATQAGTVYIKLNPAFAIGDVGIQVTDVTPPPSIYSDNFNDLDITDWAVTDIAGNGVVWNVVSDYWGDTLNGSPFIFIDSDAGGTVNVDSTVESPAIDTTAAATLFLEFDQYFEAASGAEILDVDVWDGTAWQNVYTYTGVSLGLWGFSDQQSIDISTHSNAGLKVRFHYYNANWDFYWAVDNVVIRE
ncbi:MAG: DUF4215 domain-containing protein, partial [Spirochaetia bacterium]|nr:DUF4215 domain-containing protein [Spirochaetia bacterium]